MLGAVVHTSRGAQMGWGKRALRGQQKSQDGSCHHMQQQTLWGLQSSHLGYHLGFSNTLSPHPLWRRIYTPQTKLTFLWLHPVGIQIQNVNNGVFPPTHKHTSERNKCWLLKEIPFPKDLILNPFSQPQVSLEGKKKCLNVYFLCVPEPVILLPIYGETWCGGGLLVSKREWIDALKNSLRKKTDEQLTQWLQQHPVQFAFLSRLRALVLSYRSVLDCIPLPFQ